jgi:hypothetical protein
VGIIKKTENFDNWGFDLKQFHKDPAQLVMKKKG